MILIFRLFIQQRRSGSCRVQTHRSLFSERLSIICTYGAAEASVDTQSGPKKCIHSLLINIFGINLNEISISG